MHLFLTRNIFSCERALEEGSLFYIIEGLWFIICEVKTSYKLLFLGHRSLIKNITQITAMNIVLQRISTELDVSYARLKYILKSDRYNFLETIEISD